MSENQQISPQPKPKDYFSTEHLKGNLKQRSVRGGAITLFAQGSKFFLQISSMAVLGRLLTPNDYGLIGMVTPIIGFVELFKDLGLSTATIQREEINHQQVSTLFWINVVVSICISIIFASLAPAIAWFYKEPRLTEIVFVLSSIFLFGGLSIQHQALLKRRMQFGSIAKIEIISVILGVFVAIAAAWVGLGYWALVIMPLTKIIVIVIGTWIACSWRPGLPSKNANVRSMLAFGSNLTFTDFLEDINRPELKNILPLTALFVPQYIEAFIKVLDIVTLDEHKNYWLEKTPEHLRRINAIEKTVEGAKFIHILRNGIDVVASLSEMTQKYPEIWGETRELKKYIIRWENDILISSCHLHKSNHFVVRYENLVANPSEVLAETCNFLGVSFEQSMLQKRNSVLSSLIRKRERWKQPVKENINQQNSSKFYRIFDDKQREYIISRLAEKNIDLDNLPKSDRPNVITDTSCLL